MKFGSNLRCNCSFRNMHMENNRNSDSRGALIVLEGLDRSGKSSQSSRMMSYLEGLGVSAELWRFPDRSTCVGQMISSYLANKSDLDDHTIHLLFSANRWEKRYFLWFVEIYLKSVFICVLLDLLVVCLLSNIFFQQS